MSDIITKRSEEFKELTDWMVQTTREIETADDRSGALSDRR